MVFKTISDPHVGKLSLFRVYSGTLRADSQVLQRHAREPRSASATSAGSWARRRSPSRRSGPGEIGVVAKLKDTLTGDTLSDEAHPVVLPGISFPEPAISFAIQPKTRGDEDKISTALHRMAEEDPTLHHHFDPETKQLLVSGMGQLHVEIVVERMKRKYNVDVSLLPPRIPYKETVKGRAEVQGKYKKQTGGRGQYGDTWLKVEPLPRGGGFEFVDDIFGGAIPRNFIPSVEKGVRDCMKRGILAGYPVVDLRVTLYDGSYHDVDSSDMAFQIAASMGLQKGFMEAQPVPARADHERRGHGAVRARGRRHRRPQRPPRAHRGHGARRRGRVRARAGADGRDADLRVEPALDDGRPRRLLHGVLALRGSARPSSPRRSSPRPRRRRRRPS